MAQLAAKHLDRPVHHLWQDIAEKIWIATDPDDGKIIQHQGFDHFGEYKDGLWKLKQADATLCIYLWEMSLSEQQKQLTLDYYRKFYVDNKIMMASAFDGIIDCEVGDPASAWSSLRDCLAHYRGPFLQVSEDPSNTVIPFITGIGGFLQLIVMGFAGLRLGEEQLRIKPNLPSQISEIRLNGIHYGGKQGDVVCNQDGFQLVFCRWRDVAGRRFGSLVVASSKYHRAYHNDDDSRSLPRLRRWLWAPWINQISSGFLAISTVARPLVIRVIRMCTRQTSIIWPAWFESERGFRFSPLLSLPWILTHEQIPASLYSKSRSCVTDIPTVATPFNEAGYATGYFGKWHVDGHPESRSRAAFHLVKARTARRVFRMVGI